MRGFVLTLVALLASGCLGGDGRVPNGENVDEDLERARALPTRFDYAGRSVGGLELTAVSLSGPGRATFIYGTCELPEGEGGCSPPIQVQQFPFSTAAWRRAVGCRTLEPIRGVPAARHDGLVLFTGRRIVKVYARSPAEEREVARALRPIAGGSATEPLPPPADDVRALVARVCR